MYAGETLTSAARTADISKNPDSCCADGRRIRKSGRLLRGQRLERLEISVLKAAADIPEHIKVKGGTRT